MVNREQVMKIHCLSTMNKEYYDTIGKLMIHTWKECFPKNYILHLYLEDFSINNADQIILEDWSEVDFLYQTWKNNNFSDSKHEHKFSLKALSQIAFIKKYNNNKIFWIDADTLFIKQIPENFFDMLLEDYPLASWGEYSFESGTVFLNTGHPEWHKIFNIYKSIYLEKNMLQNNERWFDGELLGRSVKESKVTCKNLKMLTTKKTSTPMNWAWTGDYMRHFKANGKTRLKTELLGYMNRPDLVNLLEDD